MSLFGADETRPEEVRVENSLSTLELLKFEKDALGLYISDHPMNSYPGLAAAASCKIDHLESWFKQQEADRGFGRQRVVLAGILCSHDRLHVSCMMFLCMRIDVRALPALRMACVAMISRLRPWMSALLLRRLHRIASPAVVMLALIHAPVTRV